MKGHILIVDDEPAICSSLKRLLRRHVAQISIVHSAQEAISIAQEVPFDVVISDMNMPYMSGMDLFIKLSQISPDTIQIVITGQSEYSTLVNAINKCHLHGYISKPWDDEIVIHLIQNAIQFKKLKDEQIQLYQKIEHQNNELNKLNSDLLNEIEEKENLSKLLESEISYARKTQAKLIPNNYESEKCFSGFNYPARYLSGDFYDYIKLNESEYLFCLGDVSGKGINASLLMVKVSSLFRGYAKSTIGTAKLMNMINTEVCNAMLGDMFVTMVIGKINIDSKTIELVNAGHLPVLCINDNIVTEYFAPNIPVGIIEEEIYLSEEIDAANCKLFIYSDGLVDRTDENGEQFGFERIKQIFVDTYHNEPDNILSSLTDSLSLIGAELEDDATVLMIDTTQA